MRSNLTLVCLGAMAALCLSAPVFAEETLDLQRVIELQQKQLEEQQRQIDAQQKQFEAQRNMLLDMQQKVQGLNQGVAAPALGQVEHPQDSGQTGISGKTMELQRSIPVQQQVDALTQNGNSTQGNTASVPTLQPPATQTDASPSSPPVSRADREWETSVFEKMLKDPRNRPSGMDIPDGWIPVPGRKTDVRFGGFVQANFIHDFQDAGYSYGLFIPSQIPVPTDHTPNTEFDPRTSRLTFETRTHGAREAVYNTFLSIDFNGQSQESSIQPRLRQAYISGIGIFSGAAITVGQTWTTFQDLGVWPDIFDLEGPNAMTGLRQVLVRYSFELGSSKDLVADVALEQPETEVQNGNGLRKLPDGLLRLNWQPGWGHLMVAGMGRELSAENADGAGEDSAFGWGLSLSGQLNVPNSKDNFMFQVQGGSGVGRYVFDLGSAPEGQDAYYDTDTGKIIPLEEFGGFAAFQHYWAENWRSTLAGGYLQMNNLEEQPESAFKGSIYAVGNLVYRLYDRLDVGLEYYWGQRKNKNDQTGYANRLMLAFKYPF